METFRRLFKEFWLPTLLAIAWTSYNLGVESPQWSVAQAVKIFGPAFIFISWIVAQFFRVLKQTATDKNFEQIIETITGGETFPEVSTIFTEPAGGSQMYPSGLLLHPTGPHSLYDLTVIVTDIEKLRSLKNTQKPLRMDEYQQRFQLGTLGRAYEQILFRFELQGQNRHTFHIQSFARNGQFNQRLLLRLVNGNWSQAICIRRDNVEVHKYIAPEFPDSNTVELDPAAPIL